MNNPDEKSVKKFKKWLLYSINKTNSLWRRIVFWLLSTVVVIAAIVIVFVGILLLLLLFRRSIAAAYVPWLYLVAYFISMFTVGIIFFGVLKHLFKNKVEKSATEEALFEKQRVHEDHEGTISI